jgi:NADPH:quinone reductase-like Zn-dependent oxidoreductase
MRGFMIDITKLKFSWTLTATAALGLLGCASQGSLSDRDSATLTHRTYVLVGASSGFGQGVALKLAAHGANIMLAARRKDLLEEVAEKSRSLGAETVVVETDVSKPADTAAFSSSGEQVWSR